MRLFSRNNKTADWMAFDFRDGGVCVATISRPSGAMPKVNMAGFHAAAGAAPEALLQKIGKELHADRYRCTMLLAAGDYQLLSVDAPNVPPDELKTAIRWRLKDMLDYRVDDATIDVLDVPVNQNAAVRSHLMYAVAARSQTIEQRQTQFGNAKIPLSVIDIPEMAQRNLSALLEPEGRGVAMLSFEPDGGLLTITFAGELYLSRRIDAALAQLTSSDVEQQAAFHDRVTLELQRSLDHFDRQYHFITLSKLVLGPLGKAAAGLSAHLAANLYLPVESFKFEDVIDISTAPELASPEMQQRYFMAIGAALRHEETVL